MELQKTHICIQLHPRHPGLTFLYLIMDRLWILNIGIKHKKEKKSKYIKKYFAFTFLDIIKQLYADEVLYLIDLFREVEYLL